ncbi:MULTISPECIES: cell division protein ZipA C-terminal FtsZ-binding domain-containing protein [Candidatus Ichthyocystis]|nr:MULTISPECIES: cell division protein ZipA C-terminal FtsZ-binding domain-containing protein [Ichthyocystis]
MIKRKQHKSMDLRSVSENNSVPVTEESSAVVGNAEMEINSDSDVPVLCADTDMGGLETLQESLLDNGIYPNCLSDQVDDILILNFPNPVTHQDFADFRSKMVSIPQFRSFYWNNLSGIWQPCRVSFETKKMVFSLQLCDRQSRIPGEVVRYVHDKSEEFAKLYNASASIDDADVVLSRVNKLTKLISEVDAVIAINIIPKRTNFLGTKLRSLAEASACYYNSDWGYFHRVSTNGIEQFKLTTLDGSPFDLDMMRRLSFCGVSLSLYLPHVVDPADSFNQMLIVARRLVKSLDGQMVDDEQRPLQEHHFNVIRKMIDGLVSDMESFSLTPGKQASLRVFSESLVMDPA